MIPALLCAFVQADGPYSRLAAALPEGEWRAVQAYGEGGEARDLPSYVPPSATPLDAARAIGARRAALLDTLRRLTDVSTSEIEKEVDPAAVRRFEAFLVSTAHVSFADGRRHEAVTLLLDGLTMACRLGDDPALAIVTDAIRRDKDAIPLSECDRVRKAADAWLESGSKGTRALQLGLVRLRMRVEAFRWRYGKPPERLIDAAPVGETIDPTARDAFEYERVGDDYRLGEHP